MKVLVIGGGGREHALVWKLSQSPKVEHIYVAPGNAGTAMIAENVPIDSSDLFKLAEFATEHKIGLTIAASDQPLADGVVDMFRAKKLRIFGPLQAAAQIESSKAYAKQLMQKQHIPTAGHQTFTDYQEAVQYCKQQSYPLFVKASGLAQGKGAVRCNSMAEAEEALTSMLVQQTFGVSGTEVVIESFLDGPEVSLHAWCDGKTYTMFPVSQDHKPIFDNDQGLMTGGMGTVAPLTVIDQSSVSEQVVAPLLEGLQKQGLQYEGVLYPGLKLTSSGPKVIEYNARFGDPETQVYMRLLKTDLLKVLLACTDGKLADTPIEWLPNTYAVCVALVSGGYPELYQKGFEITGIQAANEQPDVIVFHGGTTFSKDKIVTNGGRVIYVTATGRTIEAAQKNAYSAAQKIHFEGMHYRRDIGNNAITLMRP